MNSFIFIRIFQVHTKVTGELMGQLMQVQLYSKDKHFNQKTYIGFAVVRFVVIDSVSILPVLFKKDFA